MFVSSAEAKYGGGSGTPEDPYLIASSADMQAIGTDPGDWDKHFELTADINLAPYTAATFNIIGTYPDNPFVGTFDGNSHVISNFTYTCDDEAFIGIFSYVNDPNAEIKDLGLTSPDINALDSSSVGPLVGWLRDGAVTGCYVDDGSVSGDYGIGGLIGDNSGTINNCYAMCDVSGNFFVGGLVGISDEEATLIDCYAVGNVSGNSYIGGLVGENSGNISDCYATGDVTAVSDAGGLVGLNYLDDSHHGIISNCRSAGVVTGRYYVGGLVGDNYGSILQSYSRSTVTTIGAMPQYSGGLVGRNFGGNLGANGDANGVILDCYADVNISNGYGFVGGLAGSNDSGKISNSYSVGSVFGIVETGAFVGENINGGIVSACFWDQNTSNWPGSPAGTGLPTSQMQTEGTFISAGWDFNAPVWITYSDGNDYPTLYGQPWIYYVDANDGNDINNGLTPTTPFATIQAGIDAASNCQMVLVQPGLYSESFDFGGKSIRLTSSDPTDANIVKTTVIGGAIYFDGIERPDCLLTGFKIQDFNVLDFNDVIIYGYGTSAEISRCIISGNAPCNSPVLNDCDGVISNCVIADNEAGCGIPYPVIFDCDGLIKNCTIAGNVAGLSLTDGSLKMENCIIYGNIWNQIAVTDSGILDISYSNVQGGLDDVLGNGQVNWELGNIDADPCFVRLGNWLSLTELIEGNYHLKSSGWRLSEDNQEWISDIATSRCIDAGNPGMGLGDELMSLPGDPNNDFTINLRVNMGAYGSTDQASMPPTGWALLADINNDGWVGFDELDVLTDNWLETTQYQPCDLNRDGIVNSDDFAILAAQWLATTSWYE
jgi:hypothetical protein